MYIRMVLTRTRMQVAIRFWAAAHPSLGSLPQRRSRGEPTIIPANITQNPARLPDIRSAELNSAKLGPTVQETE